MNQAGSDTGYRRRRTVRRLSRRTIGRSMIAIGAAGIVVSLTAMVVGQRLIQEVSSGVDDSLELTSDALASVTDSIAVMDSIVDTIRSGTATIRQTVGSAGKSLEDTSTALTDTGDFLGRSLPEALDAVNEVLPTIESVASSVDSALRVLARAPFGPDYDPVQPFDETIADLSTAIEPLPGQLRTLSEDVDRLNQATASVSDGIVTLGDDLAELDDQLGQVSVLLERYSATATEAEVLAASSRADLAASAGSSRFLLVLLAAVFALGQIVPIWLGAVLASEHEVPTIVVRRTPDREDDSSRGRADIATSRSDHAAGDPPDRQ